METWVKWWRLCNRDSWVHMTTFTRECKNVGIGIVETSEFGISGDWELLEIAKVGISGFHT